MKLTLIRHGITEGNKRSLYYGSTDLPLLQEGIDALEKSAQEMIYPAAQYYYTSGMLRTEQTFAVLYGHQAHEAIPGLREMDFGDFEMRTYEELQQDEAFRLWANEQIATNICPNGESFELLQKRALVAIRPVLERDEDTVCVVHGGVISCMMVKWFPGGTFRDYMPQPGTGWQVEFEGGKPVGFKKVPFEAV
ncbi:MAG: histidine phosphatase family protein [Oscillospiraceae bacterium]|nr:histidine phosphatase family protein [Oscillospiraceae bacterium]